MEKESNSAEPENLRTTFGESVVRPLSYSITAIVIYYISTLFWWLGLILFILFAFWILVETLVGGFALLIGVLAVRTVFPKLTGYRFLHSEKFGEIQKSFGELALDTGILVLVQFYHVLITLVLGYYVFSRA